MEPVTFEGANHKFGPPEGMTESQIRTIPAYVHEVAGGGNDGQMAVTVAWLPSAEELERLMQGSPIFLTMFGGLAPHCLTTSLEEAKRIT